MRRRRAIAMVAEGMDLKLPGGSLVCLLNQSVKFRETVSFPLYSAACREHCITVNIAMAAAARTDGGDFIIIDRLRGHKGQVLCAAVPEPASGEAVVATGAEDSTVRLWDLRAKTSSRVTKCLCRCFDRESITSIVFRPGDSNRLFCSAGSKVLEFDLRAKASGVLLITSPSATIDVGTEEVNEVAVHPKGEYLAAADDSGVVKVYSVSTGSRRLHKTLRNAHTSICHSVRFRPRASWDVASGALDSTLVMWDFSTGRVRRKLDFVEGDFGGPWSPSASSSSSQKVFNPPFVYSVDFSLDGHFLAAGLGDGSVAVLNAKTRDPVGRCNGHVAPISQVHYPCFAPEILVSSGNDRRLIFWDHRPFNDEATTACAAIRSSSSNGHRTAGATSVSREGSLPGLGKAGRMETMATAQHDGNSAQVASWRDGGNKKGRPRKGVVRKKKGALPQALASDRSDDATEMPRSTSDQEPRAGNGDADEGVGGKVGGVMCSVALSTASLKEKPNWITSLSTPYEALVLADTTSEVKILGRRGT